MFLVVYHYAVFINENLIYRNRSLHVDLVTSLRSGRRYENEKTYKL